MYPFSCFLPICIFLTSILYFCILKYPPAATPYPLAEILETPQSLPQFELVKCFLDKPRLVFIHFDEHTLLYELKKGVASPPSLSLLPWAYSGGIPSLPPIFSKNKTNRGKRGEKEVASNLMHSSLQNTNPIISVTSH